MPGVIETSFADARAVLARPLDALIPEDALDALDAIVRCIPLAGYLEHFDPEWHLYASLEQRAEAATLVARLDELFSASWLAQLH